MFKWFRDLLDTLRLIDQRLQQIEKCIDKSPFRHSRGGRSHIVTGHWNEEKS